MSSSRTIMTHVSILAHPHPRNRAGVASSPSFWSEIRTWALDVADDAAGGVVHELNSDLGNTSTGTCRPSEFYPPRIYAPSLVAAGWSCIPVRPKTRVTLTSLTGTFEASILANSENCQQVGRQQFTGRTYMTDGVVDSKGFERSMSSAYVWLELATLENSRNRCRVAEAKNPICLGELNIRLTA
jgi:hypothetical protein